MSIQSTGFGKSEKRVPTGRKRISTPERLLYTREQTAELLGGISVHTVRRMEAQGLLDPVRLMRSPSAKVFHRAEQVHALADGGDDAE